MLRRIAKKISNVIYFLIIFVLTTLALGFASQGYILQLGICLISGVLFYAAKVIKDLNNEIIKLNKNKAIKLNRNDESDVEWWQEDEQ
jgi:phosphate/sulfate permease